MMELTPHVRLFRLRVMAGSCFVKINIRADDPVSTRFWVFFAYTDCYAEMRREFVRGCAFSRCEQFETSPETIEQELQPAV